MNVTDETLRELVAQGLLEEVGVSDEGEPLFRLTELGIARAESFIQTVEGAEFFARIQGK